MPELATIYAELLDGAVTAVARAEALRLVAHVKALQGLKGKEPGTDDLLKLLEAGYLPDYYVGAELQIAAQLTLTTARERKVSGSGAVTFGPLKLEGSLSETFRQATTTNLSITTTLVRQSRSKGIENVLSALSPTPVPGLPPPLPTP